MFKGRDTKILLVGTYPPTLLARVALHSGAAQPSEHIRVVAPLLIGLTL